MKQFSLRKKGFNRDFSLVKTCFFTMLFLLIGVVSNAQTTLINPAGDGGFENGATFAANNWIAVNSSIDSWVVGNTPLASAGSNCAFISSDPTNMTPPWTYSQPSVIQHLYYDVTIPMGQPNVAISFKWKANGEGAATNDWDNMRVCFGVASAIGVPIANTAIATGFRISGPTSTSGMYKLASGSYQTSPIMVTGIPGTTYRLVFSWKSDSADIADPPAAIDEVSVVSSAPSNFTATANGGLWSSPVTWVGGVVPSAGNDITIPAGSIVTVDQLTSYRNLDISGTVQWNTVSNAMTLIGNLTINSGGRFLPYTTTGTGQTINIAGNFTNNGFANLANVSTVLSFNGSGSTLGGSGIFVGDGTRGIIRQLTFSNVGANSITTSQNLAVTFGLNHLAGSLNTNGKLTLDNTAQVYGQPSVNTGVASIAVTNVGSLYNVAPVVFGVAVVQYANALSTTVGTRYVSGNNVYLCTAAAAFNATPPTSTDLQATFSTSGPTLLYIGTVGSLGVNIPFNGTLSLATQYSHGNNVYQAILATAIANAANFPVHSTPGQVVGQFICLGPVAKVTVNYDATSQTVPSLTVTQSGSGFTTAPAVVFSVGVAGGTGSAAAGTAVVLQQIAGPPVITFQKSGGAATITGGLTINSDQGATILATANSAPASVIEQSSTGVGAISTSNGGLNYTVAPTVGFSLPTAINLITNPGSGYAAAPTITVTGGTLVSGSVLTSANFTITVNNGTVQSVYLTGGTAVYSTLPTLAFSSGSATLAFPAGCLPTATVNIGTNGQLSSFTMTNAGYGYLAAPTVGLLGGTFTTAATAPTARVALYNLTTNFFAPAAAAVVQGDDAAIPTNRKINSLAIASSGLGMNITNNLVLYGSTPLTLTASGNGTGNILDLGGNNLIFTFSTYSGTSSTFGTTNTFIRNGSMTLTTRGGLATLNFPYSGTVSIATGTGTLGTGSNVTRVAVSSTAAPTGTVDSGTLTGNRAYRVVANGTYGTNPTVTLNYNSSDGIIATNPTLFIAQATALTGPYIVRSVASGTGTLTIPGGRSTATTAPGPIAMTGDDFFAFSSTAAAYISAQTGNWETPSTWVGSIVPQNTCDKDVFIINGHNVTTTATGNFASNLTISAGGTLTVGTGSDLTVGCSPTARNNTFFNNGTLTVNGGTLNINGNLDIVSGATFNQSGGAIIVDGNNNGDVATSVLTTTPIVRFASHLGTVSGGTLTIIDPNASADGTVANTFFITTPNTASQFKWDAAHTTSFGNGVSTDASANTNGFILDGYVGSGRNMIGSVIIDGGAGTNRWFSTATLSGNGSYINGNLTINSGSELRGGSTGQFFVAGNIINNGTLTTQTTTLTFGSYTGGSVVSPTVAQTVSGSGVFRNLTTAPTHNFTNLVMGNTNGVTFTSNDITVASNLTVNNNAVVNFAAGKNLTLGGIVIVTAPATLTFDSNANLIQTAVGTNAGNITVKRNTAMQRLAYTYWGSPVAAQQLLAFSPLTSISPTSRFYTYNESTGAFVSVATPGSTNFVPGRGYAVRAPNTFADAPAAATAFVGTFTGVPNNGTINFSGTRTSALLGDNLLGNPYPCTIRTDLPVGFFAQNANVQTLYFWTKSILNTTASNNYASQTSGASVAAIAGGTAPNGTIQVGQGFFVTLNAAGNVVFNNGMKIANNANQFFRNAATVEKHFIKLNLTSPTASFNQIAVGYMDGATTGIDNQIDGMTFNDGATSPTMISSLINGANFVIQGRALPFTNTDEVALGFKAETAGSYILSTESFDGMFATNQDFFIKDNLTGITHNIKQTPYNFVSAAGTFNGRFQIVYQNVLNVNNPTLDSSLVVFVKNEMINIRSTVAMTNVKVYDLRGRLVYEKAGLNSTTIELNDLNTEQQVLLVQITADGQTTTKKVVY